MNFEKSIHTALWGSESWEISAHPSDPSVIEDGEEKGRRLNEIYSNFRLLFKVIDAKTRLSVQVHPDEETCKVTGGEPKTEMWCALSDGPIYAGLKKGASAADVEAAVKSGKFEELLVRHDAKFGDVFFIPGGLVHAIGDGVKLYEVQQSSNTTFRLYDWGRVGADGKPREWSHDLKDRASGWRRVKMMSCDKCAKMTKFDGAFGTRPRTMTGRGAARCGLKGAA